MIVPRHPGFPEPDPERELLPSQRNAILTVIERESFDPREFAWERRDDDWTGADNPYVPAIVQTPTRFSCAISNRPVFVSGTYGFQGRFQVQVSPGVGLVIEQEPDNAPFGAEDRARSVATLRELREGAATLELTAARLDRVDAVVGFPHSRRIRWA
jgi:hypothetical protein